MSLFDRISCRRGGYPRRISEENRTYFLCISSYFRAVDRFLSPAVLVLLSKVRRIFQKIVPFVQIADII